MASNKELHEEAYYELDLNPKSNLLYMERPETCILGKAPFKPETAGAICKKRVSNDPVGWCRNFNKG